MINRLHAAITTARGFVVLDAAMGTRLVALGLQLTVDDPALWNLSHPETIAAIHHRDVAAGCDAVITNTFGANTVWLRRFGCSDQADVINRRAVELARQAAGPDRLVIGSIGPTASEEPRGAFDQAKVLAEAGVDALLFETHRLDQAVVALKQIATGFSTTVPRLISLFTWPDQPDEGVRRLTDLGATGVGLNCVNGMESALRIAERLRTATTLPLILKPGAGLPGEALESPESFAAGAARMVDLAPILVGGCCGTDESHLAALRKAWYHHQCQPQKSPSRRDDNGH